MKINSTLGTRSGKFCDNLMKFHPNLKPLNLYTGIISWCHANKTFVSQAGIPIKRIHAYSQNWIQYFPKDLGYEVVF